MEHHRPISSMLEGRGGLINKRGRDVLIKSNQIIGAFKYKYWVRTYKFRLNLPKYVAEVKSFDEDNDNALWWDYKCK